MEFSILEDGSDGCVSWKVLGIALTCRFLKKHSQLEHSRWNVKSFLGNTCGSVPHSSAAFDAVPQSCKVMQQIVLWIFNLSGRLPSKVSRLVRKLLPQSTFHAACLPRDLVYIQWTKTNTPSKFKLCCAVYLPIMCTSRVYSNLKNMLNQRAKLAPLKQQHRNWCCCTYSANRGRNSFCIKCFLCLCLHNSSRCMRVRYI